MAGFWSSATARREVRRFLTLLSNPVKASHALTCHTQGHMFRTEESSFKQQFRIYSELYFFYFEQDIEILKCLISLHSLLLLYIPVGLMYKFTLTVLLVCPYSIMLKKTLWTWIQQHCKYIFNCYVQHIYIFPVEILNYL